MNLPSWEKKTENKTSFVKPSWETKETKKEEEKKDEPVSQTPQEEPSFFSKAFGVADKWVLSPINSLLQSPQTIGVRGVEGKNEALKAGKSPIFGTLKGYGQGLLDVLTSKDAASNKQFIETAAPKATSYLKEKAPTAYNIGTEALNYVDISDLVGVGLIGDAAKLAKLQNVNEAARLGQAALRKSKLPKVQDAAKAAERYVDQYGNVVDDITQAPKLLSAGTPPKVEPLLQIPARTQQLQLPEMATSKIDLTASKATPKVEYPANFYVDQYGHAAQKPDVFPTNQLRLNAPGLPFEEVSDTPYVLRRNVDSPNRITPKEANKLGLDTRKMGKPISAGEYKGQSGRIDFVRSPVAVEGGESIYKGGVKKEFPFQATRNETPLGKTAPLRANVDYSKGVGRIEQPFKATPGELPKADIPKTKTELPKPSNSVVMDAQPKKFSFKEAANRFYTRTVDTLNPLKKADGKTAMMASNTRNVNGTVDYILKEGLVDRAGNKIGKSLKEVAEKIPQGKEKEFWDYMSQRHNIDRAREGKNVIANYTPEMSTQAVKTIEAANPTWKSTGDEITSWIDTMMKEWGVKSGTVDDTVYKNLRETYKSYFPTQREFSQLEKSMVDSTGKRFVDTGNPLKTATGSNRDINNPIENIMNLVDRTVKTARYNEVGQTLLEAVRKNDGMKGLAEIVTQPKNVDNVVTVLENGKPVYLQINDKMLMESLKGLPKSINNAQVMRKITGVFKSLITQKNPFFAIRNIARDIPTAYVYGSESNPLKFGRDLGKAGKDILTNSQNFQRYKAVGGGMSNFFKGDAEKAAKTLTGKPSLLNRIGEKVETFNNLTETAPRLAEFNRIFDKTGDVQKALAAANDVTVNFARGGDITKQAEAFVPYLNAGVQGLDKFFRGFKDVPTALKTVGKSATIITIPEVALYLVNRDDPNYQELDNRTKDTNFLIPKGDGKFIKIPKSRELGVLFGSLFQRIARAAEGEKEAFKGFRNTVATNFAPTNPLENNIFRGHFDLKSNKDFAGRAIVPQGMVMDKRSKYLQYDEKTTEIAKWIGKAAADISGTEGWSPKEIDFLINTYTGIIGDIVQPAATIGGKPGKFVTTQFIADPVYSNQTVTNFYDNYNKVQKAAANNNILNRIPSKVQTPDERLESKFRKASDTISQINKQIRQTQDEEAIRELRKQIIQIAKATNEILKQKDIAK